MSERKLCWATPNNKQACIHSFPLSMIFSWKVRFWTSLQNITCQYVLYSWFAILPLCVKSFVGTSHFWHSLWWICVREALGTLGMPNKQKTVDAWKCLPKHFWVSSPPSLSRPSSFSSSCFPSPLPPHQLLPHLQTKELRHIQSTTEFKPLCIQLATTATSASILFIPSNLFLKYMNYFSWLLWCVCVCVRM